MPGPGSVEDTRSEDIRRVESMDGGAVVPRLDLYVFLPAADEKLKYVAKIRFENYITRLGRFYDVSTSSSCP